MNKFDEAIMSSLVNKEQHLQLTKEKYRNNQHLQKMLISKEERHDLVVKQIELGKLLENENMLLKTKLAMYEELDRLWLEQFEPLKSVEESKINILNIDKLRKQIASLDKKCDGECEI